MKKIIIITGETKSYKTKKALELAGNFQKNEVLRIDGRQFEPGFIFRFRGANENTKLILIDFANSKFNIEYIVLLASYNEIDINILGKKPITIPTPTFVITCDENITKKHLESFGQSFIRRVEIIEINKSK